MKEIFINSPWLEWAIKLQAIAQCGLAYGKDIYDIERFEQIRDIACEMLSYKTQIPNDIVKDLFCNETGYQTPKLDTRAVVFKDDKILLVCEKNEKWSLPGGWTDVLESVSSNVVKEVREEAGLEVIPKNIIAIEDRNKHNTPIYPYGIIKIYVECEEVSGEFKENSETISSGYFSLDNLPILDAQRTTLEQIKMCFDYKNSNNWKVLFD